jgi:UDP-N-acetyl-2-amino-2-deoxyglucuronate dehydrogenase
MKRFAMIGAAGYIAPRHMQAIRDTGNALCAAYDVNDSVGIMDSYFPEAQFFTVFEKFAASLDDARMSGEALDFVSIASPNDLHAPHIRFALRHGAHAICEKPLVLHPADIDTLQLVEAETGRSVYTILQLRLHPSVIELKDKVARHIAANSGHRFAVDLTYLTSRGAWYFESWKSDPRRAGGIATNIGIHFFDMLSFVFGDTIDSDVTVCRDDAAAGTMRFANADVRWFLSVNADHLPDEAKAANKRTFRNILVDGEAFEFSDGFTDLHTKSYEEILAGRGFGLDIARPSVVLASSVRTAQPRGLVGEYHPMAKAIV